MRNRLRGVRVTPPNHRADRVVSDGVTADLENVVRISERAD